MSLYEPDSPAKIQDAVEDFHRARQKAALEKFLASLTGRPADLLSYDEVRTRLRAIESASRRLEMIPLNAIVGSVNRYTDFSRSFLPRHESDRDRWTRVRLGIDKMEGLPPIEVYQIGEAYFVLDGHHRVSVARELGLETIQAYVTQVRTRVPLAPGDRPDDVILKAEYADFLEKTRIDELRPGANLLVTAPGQYQKLLEHIAVHRYFMGIQLKREVSESEAVLDWYDQVYEPVARLIRQRNLLRDFPGRTEADLYLWIMEHRVELGGGFGWEVSPQIAAEDLTSRFSPTARRRVPRLLHRLQKWFLPAPLESGPPSGHWRREHLEQPAAPPHRIDHLFDDILVAVPGMPAADTQRWPVVDFAIQFARREEARLTGLHVTAKDQDSEEPALGAMREEFVRRCAAAGVAGRLLVDTGSAAGQISAHSHRTDLVIFRNRYPPPLKPLVRLRSGARLLIRQSGAPLLLLPGGASFASGAQINTALLAYGGGHNADEALFVAAYLAARWGVALTVLSAERPGRLGPQQLLTRARAYLEDKNIRAAYISADGDAARQLLLSAEERQADLILMGGYEAGPLQESFHPSTVDRVLASTRRPVLICH